jgi:hypothetical protein
MTLHFEAAQCRTERGRYRWAVYDVTARVWYFAPRYGKKAAQALANEMNYGSRFAAFGGAS